MGGFTDLVAALNVQSQSPDGRILCTVGGSLQVDVTFLGGAYYRYASERDLAHQLGQLASIAFSRYRRAYHETAERYRDHDFTPQDQPGDAEYHERRAAVVVHGASPRQWIEAQSRGLARWDVTVRDGALRALTESAFVAETRAMVDAVLRDWRHRTIVLIDEIYGIGTPQAYRDEQYAA